MAIARKYKLKVIEDCAQAYLTEYKGKLVGTIGDYGCFSTNDFKHISTGDGGIVTVNSGVEDDYQRTHAFADKNYRRMGTHLNRNPSSLGPNYRMTELQGAVGIAQLKKLNWICDRRNQLGSALNEGLQDLTALTTMRVAEGDKCTYWFYMFRLVEERLACSREEFCAALSAEGITNRLGYIPDVVYMQPMFQNKQAYLGSHFPFDLSEVHYERGSCPSAEEILRTAVQVPISEFYTDQDIQETIAAIRKITLFYQK